MQLIISLCAVLMTGSIIDLIFIQITMLAIMFYQFGQITMQENNAYKH
jgi:hypothetical protein